MLSIIKLEGQALRGLNNLKLNIGDGSNNTIDLMDLFPTIKLGIILRTSLVDLLEIYHNLSSNASYSYRKDKNLQDILYGHNGGLSHMTLSDLVRMVYKKEEKNFDNQEELNKEIRYLSLLNKYKEDLSVHRDNIYSLLDTIKHKHHSHDFDSITSLINFLISHQKVNKLYASIASNNLELVKELLNGFRGNNFLAYNLYRKRRNKEIFHEIKHHTILRILLRNEVIRKFIGITDIYPLFKIF